MYPVGISNLDRCLQGANNIKEDSSMGKEQRGICYRRYVRNKAILRKKRISNSVYGLDWYKHDGQYSKGKIDYVNLARDTDCLQLGICESNIEKEYC